MVMEIAAQRNRLVAAMEERVAEPKSRAQDAAHQLSAVISRRLVERQSSLSAVAGRLHALSPLATLERGYAVALRADGGRLASVHDVARGERFALRLRDGLVDATVDAVQPTSPEAG
jgi:exodeoxyribonuclease VII large subunit